MKRRKAALKMLKYLFKIKVRSLEIETGEKLKIH
jgi:hypothetical protein